MLVHDPSSSLVHKTTKSVLRNKAQGEETGHISRR